MRSWENSPSGTTLTNSVVQLSAFQTENMLSPTDHMLARGKPKKDENYKLSLRACRFEQQEVIPAVSMLDPWYVVAAKQKNYVPYLGT